MLRIACTALSVAALSVAALAAACAPSHGSTAEQSATDSAAPADAGPASVASTATPAAAAAWPGTYDLVMIEDGRTARAVMTVTPRDTGYTMAMEGPPGHMLSSRFAGDSAFGSWLTPRGDTLFATMRLVGDSVHGSSRGRTQASTPFTGTRRR